MGNLAFFKKLHVQVFLGILFGVLLGILYPHIAQSLKPISDVFIKLIRMLIAPIIFLSLVTGIASFGNLKDVGRVGGSALLLFFLLTSIALVLGLVAGNTIHPGQGFYVSPTALKTSDVETYVESSKALGSGSFINIIPSSFFSPFANGEILQVLVIAILFAIGLMKVGSKNKLILKEMKVLLDVFFKIIHLVMHMAPIAACAAMAFCVGEYGMSSFIHVLGLLCLYIFISGFFVFVILGGLLKTFTQIGIFSFFRYFKTELMLVLGTSSSEPVIPLLLEKLEKMGCRRSVVGLVLPVGYSFNLAGTSMYLTLSALFIAEVTGVHLSFSEQLILLCIMTISSKGAAGVSGSGFIVLASSLAIVGNIPVSGIVLILGIDWFMSTIRGIVNVIGNIIATILIANWNQGLDKNLAHKVTLSNAFGTST